MKQLLYLVALMAAGCVAGQALDLHDLQAEWWYSYVTTLLLAIGLYGSTYGIVIKDVRRHARLIVAAVTVGVLAKAAMIGLGMAALFGNQMYLVVGIVVAQIDPLSVAALSGGSKMSQKAKSILAAWSSFDDPMTVLLGLYVSDLIYPATGSAQFISGGGVQDYVLSLGLNLGFALLVAMVWRWAKHSVASTMMVLIIGYALLSLAFATAIMAMLMLGLALIGLVLRPEHMQRVLDVAVKFAFAGATMLLGVMLLQGINLLAGVALGIMAFVAQMIVARPLTRKLTDTDRKYLGRAQQNGITAIILALRFELCYPGVAAIVAPALVVANAIHALANLRLERQLARVQTD